LHTRNDKYIKCTHIDIFGEIMMLETYKEILDEAKSAKLETLTAWYSLFRMKEDPFLSQIPEEEIDYFVDREDIVNAIIYDLGVASRGIPVTVLIVGPNGFGKTATLQYIVNILKRLKQEYPKEYAFNGELLSTDYLFQEPASEDEKAVEEVQLCVKKCKEKKDFLFVDDVRVEHAKTIMREFVNTELKVFAISAFDYEEVYSTIPIAPKSHFLQPLDFENVMQMLDKRVKCGIADKSHKVSILDLFEEKALKTIHQYSFGVPSLILKCASKSLNILLNLYHRNITSATASKQKVTQDIAIKACKITKCLQAYTEFENLSRIKREVLQQVLKDPKSPTEVSSILQKDRTTISRHLSDLRELGLVDFEPRGRESMYVATEAVKIKFEMELIPKGA